MITIKADNLNVAHMNTALKQGFGVTFDWWGPPGSLTRYLRKLTHDVLTHIDLRVFREEGMVEVLIYPAEGRMH